MGCLALYNFLSTKRPYAAKRLRHLGINRQPDRDWPRTIDAHQCRHQPLR